MLSRQSTRGARLSGPSQGCSRYDHHLLFLLSSDLGFPLASVVFLQEFGVAAPPVGMLHLPKLELVRWGHLVCPTPACWCRRLPFHCFWETLLWLDVIIRFPVQIKCAIANTIRMNARLPGGARRGDDAAPCGCLQFLYLAVQHV